MNAVVVVDSGVANIGSVVAALERAQAAVTVSRAGANPPWANEL